MSDYLTARPVWLSVDADPPGLIEDLGTMIMDQLMPGEVPVRFAVTESLERQWYCDIGIHVGSQVFDSIFRFKKRSCEDTSAFNVVMLVPTGIGAEIGGHAGDATPAAALLSNVCDTLITHPNVLNGSDIIQIPPNALYVEGNVITQLMMGSVSLSRARNNRLLVLIQAHDDELFTNAAINSVNAARSSYGLDASIAELDPRFRMISEYTSKGIAAGRIEGIEHVYDILDARHGDFDAVAITSVIELPPDLHENYYRLAGELVNHWAALKRCSHTQFPCVTVFLQRMRRCSNLDAFQR